MARGKWCIAFVVAALFAALALPSAGFATGKKVIVIDKGVANARLGQLDKAATVKLKHGKVRKAVKDEDGFNVPEFEVEHAVEHAPEIEAPEFEDEHGIETETEHARGVIEDGITFHKFVGRKLGKKFALEVHADANHEVFEFVVNDPTFKTAKGIHVGSTEKQMRKKHKVVKEVVIGGFNRLQVGKNTFFLCKGGKVKVIKIVKM